MSIPSDQLTILWEVFVFNLFLVGSKIEGLLIHIECELETGDGHRNRKRL